MPNTFLSPTTIARAALGLLTRDIVLPQIVSRTAEADFGGMVGNTINIRKPASLNSRTYTDALRNANTPIVVDDLAETSIPLVLDQHLYSAVAVTDEQLSFNIVDFGVQVLEPQVRAVAIGLENIIAGVMNGLASETTFPLNNSNIHATILTARKMLNDANVPFNDRFLAVSSDVEMYLLQDAENRLIRYESAGDSPNVALREATIGKLYGFTVVTSNALTANTAVAFHRDAFAMALRAPVVPAGVAFGQSASYAGLALRWIRDYDALYLRDRSVVSALGGAVTADGLRVVKITRAAV